MMKTAIFSREAINYTTGRLKKAAEERGYKIRMIDTMKFGMFLEEEHPDVMYKKKNSAKKTAARN